MNKENEYIKITAEKVLGKKEASNLFNEDDMKLIDSIDDGDGSFKHNIIFNMDILASTPGSNVRRFVKACEFVTHFKYTNNKTKSYILTFPDRILELEKENKNKNINVIAYGYFTQPIVQKILEKNKIKKSLIYADKADEMLHVLFDIAKDGRSEIARVSAAKGALDIIGADEETKFVVEHNIGNTKSKQDFVEDMRTVMKQMTENQKGEILSGSDLKKIANTPIAPKEVIDADIV
jgi:hypothetical protein